MSKSMRISVEVDVHSVTCPGVWFPCKSPVYLSICFLGFHVKTKPFPAAFPLLFGDKFVFEKTFPGTSTLQHLQATLEGQPLYVELLQEVNPGHSPGAQTVLATFETSGLEFLFPYPQLRPTYTSGVDVDLLMEPTRDFPGIISPKIEASTRTHINETRHAHLDQLHDNALTLNGIPPMDKHPHIPPCNTRPCSRLEDRDLFAWRKCDEDILDRKPSAHMIDMPPPGIPHHGGGPPRGGPRPPTPPSHMYQTPGHEMPRSRSRSLPRTPPGHIGQGGGNGGHRSRSRSRHPHPPPPGPGAPHSGPPNGHRPPSAGPHIAPPPPVPRDYHPAHHPVQPPAPPPAHPVGCPPPPHSAPPTPNGHHQPIVRPHTPHTPPEHVPLNPHPLPHHGPPSHPPHPPGHPSHPPGHPPHPHPPHPHPPGHPPHPHPPHPHTQTHCPVPPDCHCHSARHFPPPPPPYPHHHPYHTNCLENVTSCFASCHIDAHPHFPTIPASQPHLHSKTHYPNHPASIPCNGPCCQHLSC